MFTKKLFFNCMVLIALTGSGTALWGQPAGFAYVANCGIACGVNFGPAGNVSGYRINRTTGGLEPAAGSPFPAELTPISVTVDPTGQFAYVANFIPNNVSAYRINGTTGALTRVPGSPFRAGTLPASVTTTAGPPPPVL